jgi:outer membrane protein TolC
MAQADLARANAQLSQAHDVYVPSLTAGAGLGEAYGYSPNPPTLFTFQGGSLVYNAAQMDYIRSARSGVKAANLALADVREAVAEDAAVTFVSLTHNQQRAAVIQQQDQYAKHLIQIVQDRLSAGQDTEMNLTQAQLSEALLTQALLHAQDEAADDLDHLARLTGLTPDTLRIDQAFPQAPVSITASSEYPNPGIASQFESARAKQLQAFGDSRFRFRPQVNLVVQYNRYATFTDSFAALQRFNGGNIGANEGVFGVQISIPLYDKFRQAKARESTADYLHAYRDAQNNQMQALDGQARLRRSINEIQAQARVATLQQKLAQQQLDILRLRLQVGNPDGVQMTPKDEQNALISERDKYLAVVDATFQLHQSEINLMRQTGGLADWLKAAARTPDVVPALPHQDLPTAPKPN